MNETQAYRMFIKNYCPDFHAKLHGNQYQCGLPDLIFAKGGKHAFFEFKMVDGMTLPWSKCRLMQHLTMLKMQKANIPVWYVAYSKKTESFWAIAPSEVTEKQSTKLERPVDNLDHLLA